MGSWNNACCISNDKLFIHTQLLSGCDDLSQPSESTHSTQTWFHLVHFHFSLSLSCSPLSEGLTNLSRKVFSRSAPMHPAKPRINITPPTTMKSQTGSRPPRSVMDEMLDSTPWVAGWVRRHKEHKSIRWWWTFHWHSLLNVFHSTEW